MVICWSRFRKEVVFSGRQQHTKKLGSYPGKDAAGIRRKRMSNFPCNNSIVQGQAQKQRTRKTVDSLCDWETIETVFRIIVFCKSAQSLRSSRKHVWRLWIPSRSIRAIWYGDGTINCSQWNQDRSSFGERWPSISKLSIAIWRAETMENNFMQKLVVNTLFQEVTDHHNQKDGSREAQKLDPCWKLRPVVCMANTELKFKIWSLKEDNTQSWVRISHGSNKFVMDSNNNDTEIPEDLPEEQALQLKVNDFACRSKARAKPKRREPDYSPSIIPMNEMNVKEVDWYWTREFLRTRFRRK